MAIECDRWQWREVFASEHGPADPSTRLVLFALALHMNQRGENAWPAQALIAKRTGLSERSVRTHLAHAKRTGWIRISNKPRKGQAWFVHQYVATIPDELAKYCTTKPWEDDPTWQRTEDTAGRQARPRHIHPANPAGRTDENGVVSEQLSNPSRPANGAERPAILSERAAIDESTPGKICRDARQGLPTNSSLNSPSNSSCNSPEECGVAGDSHARVKTSNWKMTTEDGIRQAIARMPAATDEMIANYEGCTVACVQQLRAGT